jgi:hypothetical protein
MPSFTKAMSFIKNYFKNSVVSGSCMTMLRHTKRALYENTSIWNNKRLWSCLTILIRQILPLVTFNLFLRLKNTLLEENIKREKKNSVRLFSSVLYTIHRKGYGNAYKNWIKILTQSHCGEYFEGLTLYHRVWSTSENWPSCIHIWTYLVLYNV